MAEQIRVFVGGLTPEAKQQDLINLFQKFTSSIHLDMPLDSNGQVKGFVYFNISKDQYQKIKDKYHHSKWKGGCLRIEQAKIHYTDKLKLEHEQINEKIAKKESKIQKKIHNKARKWKRIYKILSKESKIIEKKIRQGNRLLKGWKKDKFGRCFLVVKDPKLGPVDFSKYTKFYKRYKDGLALESTKESMTIKPVITLPPSFIEQYQTKSIIEDEFINPFNFGKKDSSEMPEHDIMENGKPEINYKKENQNDVEIEEDDTIIIGISKTEMNQELDILQQMKKERDEKMLQWKQKNNSNA